MSDRRAILSTLWIFTFGTYIYSDIAGLMDSVLLKQYMSGTVNGLRMTEGFLLGGVVLMMIPISMIILSRVLRYRANRITNIVAATAMTAVQAATLFVGSGPTLYYAFSSAVVIAATAFIVWYAATWHSPEPAVRPELACGAPGQPACELT